MLGIFAYLSSALAIAPDDQRGAYILDYTVKDIDGNDVELTRYEGRVLLVVNVASKCGFTPQYEQLQKLHERYNDKGLSVIGFPSNDFLRQEPGSNEEVKQFCTLTYGVSFDMFAKIHVRGKNQSALYGRLTSKTENSPFAGAIKWNFTKFVVGRDGRVCARFGPPARPDDPRIVDTIERELARNQ